jgi:hypothetical protein
MQNDPILATIDTHPFLLGKTIELVKKTLDMSDDKLA